MTAWIIGIDKENPQHWEYAKRHRFWDMTLYRPFEVDDVLYFWQAGGSLLGSVRVTQATHEIALGTPMPWNLEDSKRDQYRYRVRFDVGPADGKPNEGARGQRERARARPQDMG